MDAQASRLQPIDTSTLHEKAYLHLRSALMAGLFRPGDYTQVQTSGMPQASASNTRMVGMPRSAST